MNTKILHNLSCWGIIIWGILLVIIVSITYNFDTGFWFDKPYLDESYYEWHPHEDDSCETLQEKLNLFHPDGINPVRFELLKAMFQKRCEVDLGK